MTRTYSMPVFLAGYQINAHAAGMIERDAPQEYRDNWIRGAVNGYLRQANGDESTPKQRAFRAGYAYGARLRLADDRAEQQRDAKLRGAA
jgi:hypothetical protein